MEFPLDQLSAIAKNILDDAARRASHDHATVIAFSGDLGAGKTTMIKEMARQLGVLDDLASPTFVIYKIYKIQEPNTKNQTSSSEGLDLGSPTRAPWKNVIHGDMYRLESSREIVDLGWEQLVNDPDNLILIEWPEKIADVIPDWAGRVELRHNGAGMRNIDITK